MLIETSRDEVTQPFLQKLFIPAPNSHKGQNGRVLIVGGSRLFHAASLWAAETASHFVDMVHYASTKENEEIFLHLKTSFRNGIIVPREHMLDYIEEDDAILVGPGMVRGEHNDKLEIKNKEYKNILKLNDEGELTYQLTHYLIHHFPHKRFVFDAGALQMMKPDWLLQFKTPPILTPHQLEFMQLFGVDVRAMTLEEKQDVVKKMAKRYHCIILLKAIDDIVSDGEVVHVIRGGNQGLTKGGSGDTLAGLTVSFYAKNDPVLSVVAASILLKKTADELSKQTGYWYNISELISTIPEIFTKLLYTDTSG